MSDYSRLIAEELSRAGDRVHVYAPAIEAATTTTCSGGAEVHRLPGHFGPNSLRILDHKLRQSGNDSVLVQYVPHAYGLKAMNLPFCLWLCAFGRAHRRVTVMFHEATAPHQPGQPMRYHMLAAVTRLMAMLVVKSATTIFVSIPAWKERLAEFAAGKPIGWLPVPSNVAVAGDQRAIAALRTSLNGNLIAGHFGTFNPAISQLLTAALPRVLAIRPEVSILLIGRDGIALRQAMLEGSPHLAARIHATGAMPERSVSIALSACDLMVQPYPDGVSTRRTTVMAALAHGRAVVANSGAFTEPLWAQADAAALAPAFDQDAMYSQICALAADASERSRYACAGWRLYEDRFAVRHTISALRAAACA
ncbi:MAG: glycosyltransferase [Candidatus Binataceae bacterium]